jgi:hypothetical protein
MNIPVFLLELDENNNPQYGLQDIALVEQPAYESNFLKFSKEHNARFAIQNEEKRIITGAVMIPNKLVYREENNKPFYVAATKETIYEAAQKFAKENRNLNVKATHEATNNVEDVFIFESFITDESRVTSVKGFEDLPIGTWFMTMKVNNDNVWNDVKAGKFNGFSLEALFKMKPLTTLNESDMEQLLKAIN